MNNCYDRRFRSIAKEIALNLIDRNNVQEGVYGMVGGPNFETVSEIRMLKTCGIDAVGMSTIPEVLVANYSGIRVHVFVFSLMTNECIIDENEEEGINHGKVINTAK